jgi:glycosyltransferase involved in cell wall biosynthesis
VSRYESDVVARHYRVNGEKVRVVHNGVTPLRARRPRRRRRRDPVVLFLGRVTAQKGPAAFLDAAERVLGVEPRATFVVAGSGDLWPWLVETAARRRLARRVRFTGFLRGPEVARAFAAADVYVMPSVSEPFGISPLEAMSMGVPVVVSSRSGVSEVVSHALVADPDDVDDTAGKILAVLRRRRLGWDGPARRLLDVYREARR